MTNRKSNNALLPMPDSGPEIFPSELVIALNEILCQRNLASVSKQNKLPSDDIRNGIGILSCIKYIQRQQIQWFGHFMRKERNQLPTNVYDKKTDQVTQMGRKARNRWIENINILLYILAHAVKK